MKVNVTLIAEGARCSGKTTVLMICGKALEVAGYKVRDFFTYPSKGNDFEHTLSILKDTKENKMVLEKVDETDENRNVDDMNGTAKPPDIE